MIPTLVTGHLNPNAKLIKSGTRRGIKYEIWYDQFPYLHRSGSHKLKGRLLSEHKPYAAVVYTPYMYFYYDVSKTAERGVEAEQISWSSSLDAALIKADRYIERLWKDEMSGAKRGYPDARYENPVNRNPLSTPAWMVIGSVAAVGILSYVFFSKPAAAQLSTPSAGGPKTVTVGPTSQNVNLNVGDTLLVQLTATQPNSFLPTWSYPGATPPATPGTFTQSGNIVTEIFTASAPGTMQLIFTPASIDSTGAAVAISGATPITYNVTVS